MYCIADFIKKVLSVYTHSMTNIYLSLSAQVAKKEYLFHEMPGCLVSHACNQTERQTDRDTERQTY